MKTNHIIQCGLMACLLGFAVEPAVAGLKINLVYLAKEPPPEPPVMVGGGNLQAIMEVAAKNWERVFNKGGSEWELTIEYDWGTPLAAYGHERMLADGGNPVRISRSRIIFRNTPPANTNIYNWYADPTPKKNSEYTVYESSLEDIHDADFNSLGEINVGRVLSGAKGLAVGRVDLLTVATHEIGHALGLDTEYVGHIRQFTNCISVLITPPLPFAGYEVTMNMNGCNGDHMQLPFLFPAVPLMVTDPFPGTRQLITGIDALLISQFSSFERPNLGEPPGAPKESDEQ